MHVGIITINKLVTGNMNFVFEIVAFIVLVWVLNRFFEARNKDISNIVEGKTEELYERLDTMIEKRVLVASDSIVRRIKREMKSQEEREEIL